MRIPAACLSPDLLGLMPFRAAVVDGVTDYRPLASGIRWDRMYRLQYGVKVWKCRLEINLDEATAAPGAPLPAVYEFLLSRQVDPYGAEGEWALLRPGARSTLGGLCDYKSSLDIVLPGDDYFSEISWKVGLGICSDQPPSDGAAPYGPAPLTRYSDDGEELFFPSVTLVASASYSDGAEGVFRIQAHFPEDPEPDVVGGAGTFDGIALDVFGIGMSPTYAFGGVGPSVILTPLEWYPFDRMDGSEAIFDSATGAVNEGRSPYEKTL